MAIHLTPKASQAAIGSIVANADGKAVLKARVTAAPEKSRANDALCRMLAKEWGLAPGRLSVISGVTARTKTVRVEDAGGAVLRRLEKWAKDRHG